MNRIRLVCFILLALCAAVIVGGLIVSGEGVTTFQRTVLDSGGGFSANGDSIVSSSIGQPITGPSIGQSVQMHSGFYLPAPNLVGNVYIPFLTKPD